jgi:hypothetical protein
MATQIRNTDPNLKVVCDAHNDLKAQVGAGASFHLDASEVTVAAANASDLASSLTLVNQLLDVYKFHMADTLAHKAAGVALASYAYATDLASAIARANDIKAKLDVHRASTTYHYNADAGTVAAANATDQTSLNTLLNELKGDLNAHMASAPAAKSMRLISA